jgi:hypothetical protein
MSYQDPKLVTSPQEKLSNLEVLFNGGEGSYSVAKMLWEGGKAIGIRWNGEGGSIGTPNAFGNPTWFIMPLGLGEVIEDIMNKIKPY